MADNPPLDLYPLVRSLKSLLYGVADETLAVVTPCAGWTVGDLLDHLTSSTWAFTRAARKTIEQEFVSNPAARVAGEPAAEVREAGVPELPPPSAARLHPQWRSRVPPWFDELADSWAEPAAWTGTAQLGGVTLPAERMGLLAATELAVHGWDLARATGQNFAVDPRTLEILAGFLAENANKAGNAESANKAENADKAENAESANKAGDADKSGKSPLSGRLPIPEQRTARRHSPEDFAGASPWLRIEEIEDAAPLLDRVVALTGRDPAWRHQRRPRPVSEGVLVQDPNLNGRSRTAAG